MPSKKSPQKAVRKSAKTKKSRTLKAVILAAGESSRFKPLSEGHHKALTKLHGKPLIRHTAESALKGGADEIIIVHGPNEREVFEDAMRGLKGEIKYVVQPEAKGMGNALLHAAEHIGDEHCIVLNADRHDAEQFISALKKKAEETGAGLILLSTETNNPQKYGVLKLHPSIADRVAGMVEKPKAGEEPSKKRVVGIYLLPPNFMDYYKRVEERQYAFEDAIDLYARENDARAIYIDKEPTSTKYAFDLLDSAKILCGRIPKQIISKNVQIAKSAVIQGNVFIGEGTRIFENAVVKGPAYIGKNCVVGNNALVRENSILEDGVAVGMNTEVTRSVILEGTHVHSGFIGDSVIGRNCRIGANFVTANRRLDRANVKFIVKGELVDSGKSFLGCVIGHETKTGISASTMPGTIIGSKCIIGSGTEVKGAIESNTTVYTEKIIKTKPNK